jgi:hypothetical protein
VLPVWTGDFANTPGIYFAKILENSGRKSPVCFLLDANRILEDTRLPALQAEQLNSFLNIRKIQL